MNNIIATYYRQLADATEVEINTMAIQLNAMKRRRDAFRKLAEFFTPPEVPSLGTPLPMIVAPPGGDPDFDDDAPGQEEQEPEQP